MTNATTTDTRQTARQSQTGQRLTQAEFDDAYAISGIVNREIQKTGSFYEARENFAFAYAKGKKISPDQAQGVLNDIYKARYGQSMNQTREALIAQDQKVTAAVAAPYTAKVGELIQQGETMPFYKAQDQVAGEMARTLGITEKRAKSLMKEDSVARFDKDLFDMGKELEAAYHEPVQEAKVAQEKAQQPTTNGPKRTRKKSVTQA